METEISQLEGGPMLDRLIRALSDPELADTSVAWEQYAQALSGKGDTRLADVHRHLAHLGRQERKRRQREVRELEALRRPGPTQTWWSTRPGSMTAAGDEPAQDAPG